MSDEYAREELQAHLDALAELQRIDSELARVRSRLAKIPARVVALETRLRDEEQRFAEFSGKREDHLRERRDCEREIKAREEKIQTLESQLFKVKTQREYDAIGHEVAGLKREISEFEDKEIALLDGEDRHSADVVRQRAALEELRRETKTELERLEANRAEDERAVTVLEQDRPRFADGIPDLIIRRYTLLRERFQDTAVVSTTDQRTCGGCSMQLVSQTLLSLNLGTRFTVCEHCGRVLRPANRP